MGAKRIGFFVGDVDISSGGVASYAGRLAEIFSTYRFGSDIELSIVKKVPDGVVSSPSRVRRLLHRLEDSFAVLTKSGPSITRLPSRCNRDPWRGTFDLLHSPYCWTPTKNLPFICTMHDVQELHFPEYFSPESRIWRAMNHADVIRDARRVVVSFQHVKDDLVQFFRCPDSRVEVVPLPILTRGLTSYDIEQESLFRRRYYSAKEFFLYPAQTWPHKNHLRLLDAFEKVCETLGGEFFLICTGACNDYFPTIRDRLAKSPVANKILFTGVVPEAELRWLYENAAAVVLPTLYEAGSFPLLEAMSMTVPVICARTTSLPATIGSNEFVFDPYDVEMMAFMMCRISKDSEYRQANKELIHRRIQELENGDIAARYEALWRSCLNC